MSGSNGVPSADDSLPPGGRTLEQAFEALVGTLNDRRIRYAIIGGIALIQHTRVRTTDDIDALLAVPQIQMAPLFEALAARGFALDVERATREFRDGGMVSGPARPSLIRSTSDRLRTRPGHGGAITPIILSGRGGRPLRRSASRPAGRRR
jgi:hypothetical protein